MKLLIVDDHEIVRKGIVSLLEDEGAITEIQEASHIEEALASLMVHQPDITLVDINLGGENGLDFIKKAKRRQLKTLFIILTSSSKREDFLCAKNMGVEGYILKDADLEEIIYGIKTIYKGKKFYDSRMMIEEQETSGPDLFDTLTGREKEILEEVGNGLTNKQIAEKLYITENTVKKHITNLLGKLGVKHRVEMALYLNERKNKTEN